MGSTGGRWGGFVWRKRLTSCPILDFLIRLVLVGDACGLSSGEERSHCKGTKKITTRPLLEEESGLGFRVRV